MSTTSSEIEISWQDYLSVGLLRKWYLIVPLIASVTVGVCVSIFSPRIYESRSLILVRNEKLINPLIQGLAMPTEVSDRLNTLREEILSWSNLTRLIEAQGMDRSIKKDDPMAYDRLVKKLRNDIAVKMQRGKLIQISYEGRDPTKVQEMVAALTDLVIERNTAIQLEETGSAVSFIEAELNEYRKKLEESEGRLRQFKELHMTQMPVVTSLNKQLKDLELLHSNLLINNTEEHPRVIEVQRQLEEVRRRRDAEIQRLVARGGLSSQDESQYDELLKELQSPTPAAVGQAVDENVAKARETYAAVVEGLNSPGVVAGPGSQIDVTSEGTTVQFSDAAATSLTLSPRLQQELSSLTRDYSVNEGIYRGLLQKLERAKITGRLGEDEEGGKFVVIERARFPLRPFSPNIPRVMILAVVLGIVLGIAAVMAAEYLDQSIQTSEEASELLQVPVLGTISTIVTELDLQQRRRRRQGWISYKDHYQRLHKHVIHPVWSRVDHILVRWGL